ncbi:CAP domain-containing protein [Sporolactobacillus shoreicorticis]|uniref:CAP domain-containing protein n=1 Tax=Sporolactobacillus shoreicorticis TaxID=1923877 RepID=A0ABW5S345_9BACL|nr:CAP domain-containing protein [Sporolactobacillus shoreicorticis]MCO7125821.1 CAP domain-containing protein [Sporolactobacillus shoreicorticis]
MRLFKHTLAGLLIIFLSLTLVSITNADHSKSAAESTKQSQPAAQQRESIASGVEAKTVKKHVKKKAKKPTVKKSIKKSVKKKAVKKAKKSVKKKAVKKKVKKAVKKTTVHKTAVKKTVAKKAPVKAAAPKTQATASGQYNASVEQQIVSLVNNVRARNGLQALQVKPGLQSFARQWSQQQFSHGAMSHGMMNFSRNTVAGQNVAYAKGDINYFGWDQIWSAQATMDGWMNSPKHRANILKPQYKYIGVGVVYGQKEGGSDGWVFFTQDFSD